MALCFRKLQGKISSITNIKSNYRSTLSRFHSRDKSEKFKERLQNYLHSENDMKLYQWGVKLPDLHSSKGLKGREYYRSSFSQNPSRFSFEQKNLPCFLFRHLFKEGYSAISSYINQDESQFTDQVPVSTKVALEALRNFALTKAIHEAHLKMGKAQSMTETDIVCVMTLHLLAQLLPKPDNYLLDYTSGKKPNGCPCGCGQLLQYGVTSVGNKEFFYGRPDIVLFASEDSVFQPDGETSTAFTIRKTKYSKTDHKYKQIKNNFTYKTLENEDMLINEAKQGSFDEDGLTQLLKEAIAMSFCYRKRLLNGKDRRYKEIKESIMIPCCGITSTGFIVALYDSSNDVLLCSQRQPLFTDIEGALSFSSVVNLWMIINHALFCNGLSKAAIAKFKGSGLGFDEDEMNAVVQGSNWFFDINKERFQEKSKKSVDPEIFSMADD